jgi:hypothetical protein
LYSLYQLVLALWAGGITIFTFIVTPALFLSYGRDMAGEIVSKLFPGYFRYNLVLSAAAFLLFFFLSADRSRLLWRLSLALLAAALIVNLFIMFRLHPDTVSVKREVASFEREPADSLARRQFRRLHAVSAGLNLFLFVDGVVLLLAAPFLRR